MTNLRTLLVGIGVLCILTCGAAMSGGSDAAGGKLLAALGHIEGGGSVSRVVSADDGTFFVGKRGGSRAPYDGSMYQYDPAVKDLPERILELGPNAVGFKDADLPSSNPYLVDVTDTGCLIINLEAQASFPDKHVPGSRQTGNVFLFEVGKRKLTNLTRLKGDADSALYASAIAYVPQEKVIVVNLSALEYDEMPYPKHGTGRPQFLSLKGKEIPPDSCPIAAGLYANWRSVQPSPRVADRGRVWEWQVSRGQFVTISSSSPTAPPAVHPLSTNVFYLSTEGLGTFVIDAKTRLLTKISPHTAAGWIRGSGQIVLREAANDNRQAEFHLLDIRRVLADLTSRAVRSAPAEGAQTAPASGDTGKDE